jgi:CBS domain-containing protein
VTSRMRDFRREDFARFHPAGALGRQLSKVDEFMRSPDECRVAPQGQTVREVFVEHSRAGRRTGAIMLTDKSGKLAGLFTDSDLARLFEHKRDAALDRPIREVMIRRPATVPQGSMMLDAVAIMAERRISELPVVDRRGRPLGMLDVTDVVALFPEAGAAGLASQGTAAPRPQGKADRPRLARLPASQTKRRKPSPPKTRSRDCA